MRIILRTIISLLLYLMTISFSFAETRHDLLQSFVPKKPITHTLDNGLQLIIDVDKRAPVVRHTVWYKVGSADEKAGESGIAHFLEHLLFRGTKKHPPGYFSKRISDIGGDDNAFTTYDLTAYYQNIPNQHISEVMTLESDRMRNLKLDHDEFIKERNVILEERALRIDTNPTLQLLEQMRAILYRNHPYGSPVIGWRHEIEALNQQQVQAFYKKYYAPNNAIVTVVGDVNPDEILKIAQETYGEIPSEDHISASKRSKEPPQIVSRTIKLQHKNVHSDSLYLLQEGVSPVKQIRDFYALSIMLGNLANGSQSFLYKKLVKEQKLALDIGVYFSSDLKDNSPIIFQMSPAKDVSLDTLRTAFQTELEAILKSGITLEDLEREKNEILVGFINGFDNREFKSKLWASIALGYTIQNITDFSKTISEITQKDVNEISKKILTNSNQVWGYLEAEK